MNSPAKAHEPTMEEILASIRRIISDDEPGAPKPAASKPEKPAAPEPAGAAAVGQDDIDAMFAEMDAPAPARAAPVGQDDIDAMFAMDAPTDAPAPPPPPAFEEDLDVLELTEDMAETPRPAPEPMAAPSWAASPAPAPPVLSKPASSQEDLLSAAVGAQVANAFGTLAHTVLAGNARTLDDIVQEMLRPMLRAWLDDNLPPLVERLVRQEIERVARGGR